MPFPCFEFGKAMELIKEWCERTSTDDQLVLLDFVLKAIREDVKTDLLSTILYSERHFEKKLHYYLFPFDYVDEQGKSHNIYLEISESKTISLADECVWVMPWDRVRLKYSILNIFKTDFEYDESNHKAYYYKQLDICHVTNGNHSISSGTVYRKGYIKAQVVDISKMFDHVHTDGKCWYNSHDGTKLRDVDDFRIAIMFETAKMKHRLLVGK